jgi:hypothetical protein
MCGCLGALHCGHEVSVVAVVFQFARRERVLERDVFRFGTATSVPFLLVARRCRDALQRRPSWINLVVVVRRIFRQVRPTLGTQARTVTPAYGLERHGRNHGVPEHGLEVEQVAHELVNLIIIFVFGRHLVVVSRTIGVSEQLLEMAPHMAGHRVQATHASTGCRGVCRASHQNTLHDRLQPQFQLDGLAGRYGDHVDVTEVVRSRDGPRHLEHGAWASTELPGVKHQGQSRVQAVHGFR